MTPRRSFQLKDLEKRCVLSATVAEMYDAGLIEINPALTTFDLPENRETAIGEFTGVANLTIDAGDVGIVTCTATLLPTGKHLITAAHCLDFAAGLGSRFTVAPEDVSATFGLESGPLTVEITSISIHPDWTPLVIQDGSDIAIIELDDYLPSSVERYAVYRGNSEFSEAFTKVGYGLSGQGVRSLPAGTKREGTNTYDTTWTSDLSDSRILYDFDNGLPANDYFGVESGLLGLGTGSSEVMAAPGDSGGPSFINGMIAGITSYTASSPGSSADSVPGDNSSFGDFGGDIRVSAFLPWIDAQVDIIAPMITDVVFSRTNTSVYASESYASKIQQLGSDRGAQLVSSSVVNPNCISITFNEAVQVDISDLRVYNMSGISPMPDLSTFVAPTAANNYTASWVYSGSIPYSQLLIDVRDSVTDLSGLTLDGEWTNPTSVTSTNTMQSEFPSGDGLPGGDFLFAATNLISQLGSPTGDNLVDNGELTALLDNWGLTGVTTGVDDGDFTGDGIVDNNDLSALLDSWGMNLQSLTLLRDVNGDLRVDTVDANLVTDIDGDGVVDQNDIDIVMEQVGIDWDAFAAA